MGAVHQYTLRTRGNIAGGSVNFQNSLNTILAGKSVLVYIFLILKNSYGYDSKILYVWQSKASMLKIKS